MAAAYTALFAAALAVAIAFTWPWLAPVGGRPSDCSEKIPGGQSVVAAWRTAELFVADVILARQPTCSDELSTQALRLRPPLRPFSRGYPAVPIARASRDRGAREAVYMLSRRTAGVVVAGSGGRPEIPLMVGLSAPHARRGAFDLVLVLERGSWRVDRVSRVEIVDH